MLYAAILLDVLLTRELATSCGHLFQRWNNITQQPFQSYPGCWCQPCHATPQYIARCRVVHGLLRVAVAVAVLFLACGLPFCLNAPFRVDNRSMSLRVRRDNWGACLCLGHLFTWGNTALTRAGRPSFAHMHESVGAGSRTRGTTLDHAGRNTKPNRTGRTKPNQTV